jgi:hypothetical protein
MLYDERRGVRGQLLQMQDQSGVARSALQDARSLVAAASGQLAPAVAGDLEDALAQVRRQGGEIRGRLECRECLPDG